MKDISFYAAECLLAGKNFKRSNTQVKDGKLYLFGNLIAYIENKSIFISLAGWNTPTTRDRLNALPCSYVHQVKYQPFLDDEPMDLYKFYEFKLEE